MWKSMQVFVHLYLPVYIVSQLGVWYLVIDWQYASDLPQMEEKKLENLQFARIWMYVLGRVKANVWVIADGIEIQESD